MSRHDELVGLADEMVRFPGDAGRGYLWAWAKRIRALATPAAVTGDGERWITQTKFYDPALPPEVCTGNCTEAAFASILGLRLKDVPSFQGLTTVDYWQALDDFVESRGYMLHMLQGEHHYPGLYIADGPSPRGCGHFVVMRDGQMEHDPHPSRAGLLSVERTWLLIPFDPATRPVADSEAVAESWLPIATAPRDGTLLRLLVEFEDHATEDVSGPAPTIGANNFDHDGEDEWKFAGWSWTQDEFTRGSGKPVGWMPMLAAAPTPPKGEAAPEQAGKGEARHCQNGHADVCHASQADGVICPDESCDIDDGVRKNPNTPQPSDPAEGDADALMRVHDGLMAAWEAGGHSKADGSHSRDMWDWAQTCYYAARRRWHNPTPPTTSAEPFVHDVRCPAIGHPCTCRRAEPRGGVVDLGEVIRDTVREHGSYRAAAKAIGINYPYLCQMAHDPTRKPSKEILAALGLERVTVTRRLTGAALTPRTEQDDKQEACESGAPECGPVEFHDSEGVPLCAVCWEGLLLDSANDQEQASDH